MGILAVTGKTDLTNPDSGDLALGRDGRMFLRSELKELVDQRIRVRLQFFKGEWFLNLDAGTPWFQHIIGHKGVPDQTVRGVLSQALKVDGVDSITTLEWQVDNKTRRMSISFTLKLVDGSTFKSSGFPPYVVAGY
jgi:hypothetical protein